MKCLQELTIVQEVRVVRRESVGRESSATAASQRGGGIGHLD